MQMHYQTLQNAPFGNFCVINYTFLYKCTVRETLSVGRSEVCEAETMIVYQSASPHKISIASLVHIIVMA